MRVTKTQLETMAMHINRMTESPVMVWDNGYQTIGHYSVVGAYGGYKLERTVNKHGAAEDVFNVGYVKPKILIELMRAYLSGYQRGKNDS